MGKHLLTVTAIPFLFFNQLQLCGVFEYCDILRVRPQGRNTKPHHPMVPSSTFFLPLRQMCSMFPPSIAFCGHILMAWNILSLSSQPGLPSARFYFGCSFCISPYPWKSVLSVCPTSGGCCVAYCVYGSPSPASTGWPKPAAKKEKFTRSSLAKTPSTGVFSGRWPPRRRTAPHR